MNTFIRKTLLLSPLGIATYALCLGQKQTTQKQQYSSLMFKNRHQHLQDLERNNNYDIVVVGGGATGAGVAIDASTRGLRTLVIQKNDFGSGTSSKSTKLIHGGVRYLEQVFQFSWDSLSSRYEKFKLVTQAISERGTMIRNAEYMNQKVSFVIPCTNSFWSMYYYLGSVVYYMIYWATNPKDTPNFNFPYFFHRQDLRSFFPYISDKYQSGVVYQDGCFNDARMLLMTLLTSTMKKQDYSNLPKEHVPANILNQAEFKDFIKNETGTITGVIFKDRVTGKEHKVKTNYVVNCTGTWADQLRLKDDPSKRKRICIVAGSHLTYHQKIANKKFGLCLPSADGRILLVVPWLNKIIAGTTQRTLDGPQTNPIASPQQREFIQKSMGQVMQKLSSSDLIDMEIARWSGLRPLVMSEDAKNTKDIARTHVIEKSKSGLYSLMGGKWTTYRKMGEDLVDVIVEDEKKRQNGRNFGVSTSQNVRLVGSCSVNLKASLQKQYGSYGTYLYHTYGSIALEIVKGDISLIGENISKAEIEYIAKNEMVNEVEDIIMRRLRIAFLNNRQKTLSIIPIVTQILLKNKNENKKVSQSELKEHTKQNIQNICAYEFN